MITAVKKNVYPHPFFPAMTQKPSTNPATAYTPKWNLKIVFKLLNT
jgi:hypothetical protein